MSDTSMSPQPGPPRRTPSPFLGEALGYLSGEGRRHTAAQLLEQLRARFRVAGRGKLADLVYEMAKACLRELPDFQVRTLLRAEPRAPEVISGEMSTMSDCLRSAGGAADLSALAQRRPEQDAALADARKCLDALASLEGASGRRQLALALAHVHAGEPARVEAVLRELLARAGEPPEVLRLAEVNLAFALLRQEKFADVVPLARAAQARDPQDPVPWFNLLAAQSELGDPAAFEASVRGLAALQARVRSPLVAAWAQHDLAMLAGVARLPGERAAALRRLFEPPEDDG
jgi:hypothetical protein